MNDVLVAKKVSLERCIVQIRRYEAEPREIPFEEDFFLQDAIALNIQRACELAIDMANHLIRELKLGVPQTSRESFAILGREGVIDADIIDKMARMVGFRNILVHRYQDLDVQILRAVIRDGLGDLVEFSAKAVAVLPGP